MMLSVRFVKNHSRQESASQRYDRRYTLVCLDCYKKGRVNTRTKNKERIIEAYGGKCECCGESIFEFLTIDHRNGRKI